LIGCCRALHIEPLGGPDAITFRDAVRMYEQALGRTIEVRTVAPGDPIAGLPEPVWGIAAGLESHDSEIPMEKNGAYVRRAAHERAGLRPIAQGRIAAGAIDRAAIQPMSNAMTRTSCLAKSPRFPTLRTQSITATTCR
jgi:hypothetical protein